MEPAAHLSAFHTDAARVAAAVREAPTAPVRHCPGWTVADLAVHLGVVHRWAAEAVHSEHAPKQARERWAVETDLPDLAGWYEECAAHLGSVLDSLDPDAPAWTFGPPRTGRFWFRRQTQETSVHRWDAELAAFGEPAPIDPELASDGVDEALGTLLPRRRSLSKAEAGGETFHFHRTDGDGEWLVRFSADGGVETEHTHAKGDVAVRGPAEQLLLFLWHRADPPEVFGDPGGVDRWFELVPPL